jgi:formamidopyrimidine-DNA glycosylase
MPELPEVEALRLSLLKPLIGAQVVRAACNHPKICRRATEESKTPTATELLEGTTITNLFRHGKQLAILAKNGRVVTVQLGMSGMLHAITPHSPPAPAKHQHVTWQLARANTTSQLIYRDPRRFGKIRTFDSIEHLRSTQWSPVELGPDALTITAAQLTAALANSSRMIKPALLDQSKIAGVGNIYADESLFRARIAPIAACNSLSNKQLNNLATNIREILQQAVNQGGSTLRDGTYTDAEGNAGSFQAQHNVYGKAGKPCPLCRSPLTKQTLAQRTTVWCQSCQRL